MEKLLALLAAAHDQTRLRILALTATGAFCVNDFCDILGQSQPRLSRHLRLLCEAGLLTRAKEGTNVWYTLAQGEAAALTRDLLRHVPEDDPLLAADRRGTARVLSERARAATAQFAASGADWDEMRALGLPADAVEARLMAMLNPTGQAVTLGRLLDIGTGTGRLLELLAPLVDSGLGVDASRAMLALARVRLAKPEFAHLGVRLADMYALPLPDRGFDLVVLHMVLHFAADPAKVLEEAARVLAPGGRLLIVDLAAHDDAALAARYHHRHPGFDEDRMAVLLAAQGLSARQTARIFARYPITIWCAEHAETQKPAIAPRKTIIEEFIRA